MVGGSGLYLRALLQGLFDGPSRDEALRGRLEGIAERFGDARLHRLLARVDPEAAARIDPHDRVRVVRALEVFALTGRPLSRPSRQGATALEGFGCGWSGSCPDRAALREAVAARTRQMFARGLLEEVRGLVAGGRAAGAALEGHRLPAGAGVLRGELSEARRSRS